jgi:formate hydrogenlyase subunit 3/multisubunit Na+/H+ antiporter MnhD subunit
MVLLIPPLLAAVAAYLVRRWALLAALISAATAGLLAVLCLRLPLDQSAFVLGQQVAFGRPVVVLGQTLVLNEAGKMWLAFVFGLPAIFYLFAWRMSQGRSFFPFSLVILALYALTVMLPSFALSVLTFAIAATLLIFIVQAGQLLSVRGAQRYLLVTLLAVPLLLAAAWLVDQPAVPPAAEESAAAAVEAGVAVPVSGVAQDLAQRALLPAALGFALLLATFPFGTWMPAVAADAPPLVSAFVFTVGQGMALYLALSFAAAHPDLLQRSTVMGVIQLAGLSMAASGGLMAAVQRDLGRLLGYAALADLGVVLLALASGGNQGLELALLHGLSHSVAITLMAAALSIVRHRAATSRFTGLGGVARRLPIATAGLVLGGLSLAGFPFTVSFPTRWAVSRAVWNWTLPFAPGAQVPSPVATPGQEWVWFLTLFAMLASSAGIIVGVLRSLSAMAAPEERRDMAGQPAIASLLVALLAVLTIVLGLYPQLFLQPVVSVAQAFALF